MAKFSQNECEPLKLGKQIMKECYEALLTYTLLHLHLDFRVAYAANISKHLTIK